MNTRPPIEPCPEDWMRLIKDEPDTICHVLRQIYQATKDEKIRIMSRRATAMAKRMSSALKEYKAGKRHAAL